MALVCTHLFIRVTYITCELAGTLAFYQTEGNQTYLRSNGELASDLPTEAVFELQDPQNHFRQASFTYTWDLRDGIEVSGPSSILVDQSVALTLAVNGSPPMTVCWSITSDCQVASLKHCHVLKMNGKRCILNYTFPNSGHYCLGVKVKNDISAMQAFQDLTPCTLHVMKNSSMIGTAIITLVNKTINPQCTPPPTPMPVCTSQLSTMSH
uniref:PKAT KLD domain-containing protein n=1 Tax=Erpetoichthys calabaricus TaxID=27687 RepID=A0A8C4SU88_ERPCA